MTSELYSQANDLLSRAQGGSSESLGQLLQLYSNYMRLLVVAQFEERLQMRVSPSDVIQETFCEAHRDFAQFRGASTAEFLGWLRKILVNNLYRCIEQHLMAAKRDVRREVSLERLAAALEQSTARLDAVFPDPSVTPGGALVRQEMQVILADELAALPADYRDVIVLRHLEALPFEEVGKRMGRTSGAVRMLWMRAIKELRTGLDRRGVG